MIMPGIFMYKSEQQVYNYAMIGTDTQKQSEKDAFLFRQSWSDAGHLTRLPTELRLSPGNLYKISGANGSGKTTLLQLLAGTLGTDQVELLNPSNNFVTNQDIFYLPHRGGLRRSWTGWQNIEYWCALMNVKVKDHFEKLKQTIDLFHLSSIMNIPVFKLSAGQQQKQALLRLALADSRPIWLLDEIEANLDKQSEYVVHDFITRHLNNDGVVVWASHQELFLPPDEEIIL